MLGRLLLSITALFLFLFAGAQGQQPSGYPSPFGKGWSRLGYVQGDSAIIHAVRDTSLRPRFPGTEVFWQHAGVDTVSWIWDGRMWKKKSGGTSGAITVEVDPTVPSWVKAITVTDISHWNIGYDNSLDSQRFNAATGILTSIKTNAPPRTVSLDGRYLKISDTTGLFSGGTDTAINRFDLTLTGNRTLSLSNYYFDLHSGTSFFTFKGDQLDFNIESDDHVYKSFVQGDVSQMIFGHQEPGMDASSGWSGGGIYHYVNGSGLDVTADSLVDTKTQGSGPVFKSSAGGYYIGAFTQIDTTWLSNRINQKQFYSDTNTYDATRWWVTQRGYLIGSDTLFLSDRINQKQFYSDTNTYDATRWWVNQQGYLDLGDTSMFVLNQIGYVQNAGYNVSGVGSALQFVASGISNQGDYAVQGNNAVFTNAAKINWFKGNTFVGATSASHGAYVFETDGGIYANGAVRLAPQSSTPTGANGAQYYDGPNNRFQDYVSGVWKTRTYLEDVIWNQVSSWQTGVAGGFRLDGTSYIKTGLRVGPEAAAGSIAFPVTTPTSTIFYVYGGHGRFELDLNIGRDLATTGSVISTDFAWFKKSSTGTAAIVMTATSNGGGYGKIQCANRTPYINGVSGSTVAGSRFTLSFQSAASAASGQEILWWEAIPFSASPTVYQAGVSPVFEPVALNSTWRFRAFSITPEIKITTTTNDFVGLFYSPTLTSTNGSKNYFIWAESGNVLVKALASGATAPTTTGQWQLLVTDANGLQSRTSLTVASDDAAAASAGVGVGAMYITSANILRVRLL